MIISFIAAMADNNAIGRDNGLPWYLPADLKFFKETTMGKPVLMGRKTFDSIKKPLPGRLNIVVSHNSNAAVPEGVLLYTNIEEAVARMRQEPNDEGFIVGGARIFEDTMPLADRMYITRIHHTIPDADAFFPDIDHTHWKLVWQEKHQPDEKNQYAYTFEKYERIDL